MELSDGTLKMTSESTEILIRIIICCTLDKKKHFVVKNVSSFQENSQNKVVFEVAVMRSTKYVIRISVFYILLLNSSFIYGNMYFFFAVLVTEQNV